jgi:hypothetical protein
VNRVGTFPTVSAPELPTSDLPPLPTFAGPRARYVVVGQQSSDCSSMRTLYGDEHGGEATYRRRDTAGRS